MSAPSASTTPSLVLGILSAPKSDARRDAARGSWLRDVAVLEGKVSYRFVLGYDRSSALSQSAAAIACQKLSSAASAASPHDVVLVDAPDCHMWHSPAKVHAWFKYALHAFPLTHWLGKSEEDTMIWPSALLVDMSWLPPEVQYYGIMGWQGSCRSKHASARSAAAHDGKRGGEEIMARAVSDASQPLAAPPECTGCYGHPIAEGISLCRAATCRPGGAQTNGRRCCQVGCPKTVRMSPFAVGALDVRSRSLAAAVAKCAYADRYFEVLSQFSEGRQAMCATTDGSQGHAIAECALGELGTETLLMADAGRGRLSDGSTCRKKGAFMALGQTYGDGGKSKDGESYNVGRTCGDGQAYILHPLKFSSALMWNESWRGLTRDFAVGIASGKAGSRGFGDRSKGRSTDATVRLVAASPGVRELCAGSGDKSSIFQQLHIYLSGCAITPKRDDSSTLSAAMLNQHGSSISILQLDSQTSNYVDFTLGCGPSANGPRLLLRDADGCVVHPQTYAVRGGSGIVQSTAGGSSHGSYELLPRGHVAVARPYRPLPIVTFRVGSRSDARLPQLRLESELFGRAGHRGASIAKAWAERELRSRKVVRWHEGYLYNKSGRGLPWVDSAGRPLSGMNANNWLGRRLRETRGGAGVVVGSGRSAGRVFVAPPLANTQRTADESWLGRRLREAPIWALNCSRLWA